MQKQIKALIKRYQAIHKLHNETYAVFLEAKKLLAGGSTAEDLSDVAFVLKEIETVVTDLRKETTSLKETFEKACAIVWSTGMDGGPIRGELATGTPRLGEMASLPNIKKDPEKFKALMDFLGCPEYVQRYMTPHWPTLTAMLTDRAIEGMKLPPGIDPNSTYPVYKLVTRRKKDVELLHMGTD